MIVFFCAGLLPGFGGAFLPVNTTSGDNLTAAFFYTEHCAACIKALPVMDAIADEYPSVSVLTYSVSGGTENESLFFRYGEAYGNSYPRYPTVFLSDGMFFEGYRAISADLPDHLASCLRGSETEEGSAPGVASALLPVTPLPSSSPTISPLNSSAVSSLSSSAPAVYSPALPPVWVVIVAGLVDGINPCAVAVLIFLLLTLVGAGGSLQMLRFGAAYVVGIYLMYFISGFGVLSAVRIVGFSFYFSCAAGFIAIIFGGIMLVDSFRAAGPGHFHISVSLLASVRQIAARGGIMSAFLAGVVVSLIELPCTGGVYLAILAMLSGVDVYAAAGLLALYNLMFVLPLVVIIAAAVAGFSPERMSVMRLESRQALRRAGGGALILLGAAVLIWFVG
ncbi:hypothetical protein [Methanogenium organophilum]|uniref:Cytochrome C biogenesis protein transmembrane domain-containing protein n=1 Tax=Methanogenium organophilum TaxID=2199 RepID=A0A9X9S5F5_METOG|nr:hypothetical protein [Methanogenium organophilum]WAI02088.1 hypothetical protein OU421_04240 [Methanogenium organophilum]